MKLRVFLLLCAAVIAGPSGANAAEPSARKAFWPDWRGPSRDGISTETGLLQTWSEEGPPLLWKVDGLGGGYSSVSIADGRIFTLGRRRQDTYLLALSLEDGTEQWATAVGGGSPNCTPVVAGDRVYALSREGHLVCAEADSGQIVWDTRFQADFGGQMMSGWGYSESPLVDGDRLICTPGAEDAILAALDRHTGKVLWKAAMPTEPGPRGRKGAAYSSVVISNGGGVRQYVQLTGKGVISVAADDGRLLWHYNRVANGTANIPTPIISENYVFCSTGYGTGSALLELQADGKGKVRAEEVYFLEGRELQNHHGGMVLRDGYIYCGNGHNKGFPVCVEMKTGRIAWKGGRGPGSGSAAVVYADGQLYFRYENGVMGLIAATPEEYRLNGEFKLASNNGRSWPHPAIANGRLYLRDQGTLLCYDIRAR